MLPASGLDLVIPRSVRRTANATRNLHGPSNPGLEIPRSREPGRPHMWGGRA
jgi:hypothetical protein